MLCYFRFPISHFGVLFGFVQCAAGIAGVLQYPLFEWSGAYIGSLAHVSILITVSTHCLFSQSLFCMGLFQL